MIRLSCRLGSPWVSTTLLCCTDDQKRTGVAGLKVGIARNHELVQLGDENGQLCPQTAWSMAKQELHTRGTPAADDLEYMVWDCKSR